MSTDADKVRAAADYVERVGLHKGSPTEYPGGVDTAVRAGAKCCTLGALWGHDYETIVFDDDFVARQPLKDFVGQPIPRWNDAPERTAEEVVTTLRAFADTLD